MLFANIYHVAIRRIPDLAMASPSVSRLFISCIGDNPKMYGLMRSRRLPIYGYRTLVGLSRNFQI